MSAAELEHATALTEEFPAFDGVRLLDNASRAVNDVVELVRFALRNNIQVAARGPQVDNVIELQVVTAFPLETVSTTRYRRWY